MCSRYHIYLPNGSRITIEEFLEAFPGDPVAVRRWLKQVFNERPRPDIRPREDIPVIAAGGPVKMNWWFVPTHVADAAAFRKQYTTFNARIEGAATSRMYRGAWRESRRVVIPMTGYYEWREVPGARRKQRYELRSTTLPLLFAVGLYETHQDNGQQQATCTMLTQDASPALSEIKDRMPVLIPAHLVEEWLRASVEDAMPLLLSCEPPELAARAVDGPVKEAA
jgi:putative SOS response-associated peptidase YedK